MSAQVFRDGRWQQACPLPLYVRSWRTLFRWRYQCRKGLCRAEFEHEADYEAHWRIYHSAGAGSDKETPK